MAVAVDLQLVAVLGGGTLLIVVVVRCEGLYQKSSLPQQQLHQ